LLWPMALFAHLRIEAPSSLALVTAIVVSDQGD
jgi:hypothetical protein